MESFGLHIKDARGTGDFYEVQSPFDGKPVAKVERADDAALEQALVNAKKYYHSRMRWMPAWERAQILYKVAELIGKNHEDLAVTIAKEGGKPLRDARIEVTRAINTTKMSGDTALELNGETITMDRAKGTENHLAYTVREPVGPVLAVSAFNHPVNLICHQVCTAFAAGNTVVVKPASQTPVSCLKMARLFREAGLEDGIINVVTASGSKTDAIVADPRLRFITFIGGETVGWEMRRKAAPGVRLALEHGGTGSAILHKDADLTLALPNIVRAGYYHAGQVCVSTQNLYIHADIESKVIPELKQQIEKLITGDPCSDKTDVGPLISKRDVQRIHEWVQEAVAKGAKVVTGGEPLDNNCYKPTLLQNTTPDMKVMNCEIFGPVVCVQSYSDTASVIEQINQSNYSFQAAIYTNDINLAHRTARQIETKACMINDSTAFRVDWMPFGGAKASGLGAGGTRHAVLDMTEEKMIVLKIRA